MENTQWRIWQYNSSQFVHCPLPFQDSEKPQNWEKNRKKCSGHQNKENAITFRTYSDSYIETKKNVIEEWNNLRDKDINVIE